MLSRVSLLEAWEIMNLDLKADLVVLSACETARVLGDRPHGQEVYPSARQTSLGVAERMNQRMDATSRCYRPCYTLLPDGWPSG